MVKHYDDIERAIARSIACYWLDADGFFYGAISGVTYRPYIEDDPDLAFPLERLWCTNGSFPYHLKRTFINYEDADMTATEVLLGYIAKAKVEPTEQNLFAAERLGGLMIDVPERVGRENPYGFRFLPKLHGGPRYLNECFEFSADQCCKWMNALDTYREFTMDAGIQQRIDAILLATARWLDARDFVTPYMGHPNYAPLNCRRHYHACFAYLCARARRLSGDEHLLDEVRFLRDRMVYESNASASANAMNLTIESLARLTHLLPEDTDTWLRLMDEGSNARVNYYRSDGCELHLGCLWNVGTHMATTNVVFYEFLPHVKRPSQIAAEQCD